MDTNSKTFQTVDEYIDTFSGEQRTMLESIRKAIQQAAPAATECISYNMPAYRQHGVLVYFAGYKNHIGFYPTSSPIKIFAEELKAYKTSKGAIQFPLNKPIPAALVKKIVKYRMEEDAVKALGKKKK
ncbi:MAG TPA: DUF1801 domain-containing protein [Phnomibacter sp.]|nr:DUF1801 domain-containing protein [Phnomibacter sp.]